MKRLFAREYRNEVHPETAITTDVHFHVAGLNNNDHIYVSPYMRRQTPFRLLKYVLQIRKQTYDEWMTENVEKSQHVDRVIVLAFDWVYDEHNRVDKPRSHFWVDNDWVAGLAKASKGRILFGASVNPNREHCLDVLRHVHAEGAALVKLIPSAQDVELLDPKHEQFFRSLKALKLPLLCHTGVEHTIPPAGCDYEKQELNHPARLSLALQCGVTVIAAHCALPVNHKDGKNSYIALRDLFKISKYREQLYGDLSGFLLFAKPYRNKMIKRLLAYERVFSHDRLILGSDFPVIPYMGIENLTIKKIAQSIDSGNVLDSNVAGLTRLGFDPCILSNANQLLRTATGG